MKKEKVPVWWMKLSEGSFTADWNNDLDAIYDHWKELFRLRHRGV